MTGGDTMYPPLFCMMIQHDSSFFYPKSLSFRFFSFILQVE